VPPFSIFVAQNFARARSYSTPSNFISPTLPTFTMKAVVIGAAGGIGQPLSLLLKTSPLISELALYDVFNGVMGVEADLSHISTPAKTSGHFPPEGNGGLAKALTGADIVVIPAGFPRKPGMTRDELFIKNGGIIKDLATACADHCPNAYILVITNPVNSTVPVAAEALKAKGAFNPKKLFGVTTLDVLRAETFLHPYATSETKKLSIPVIGGHSGKTIVPLFSQAKPAIKVPEEDYQALLKRIQFGGDEVVDAKGGAGSATLSMAFAAFRFAETVIKASQGETGLVEPAFVYLPGIEGGEPISKVTGSSYFSVPIEFGKDGAIKAVDVVSGASEQEKTLLATCYTDLKDNIAKGEDFGKQESAN